MHPLPHRYRVQASAAADGDVPLQSEGLPVLPTAAPPEFDGPGERWSPETMLVGAVAACFHLTFRSIARASKLPLTSLVCAVEGTLDRVDGKVRFTRIEITAHLSVPPGVDTERARRLLKKAEQNCLITQSLAAEIGFVATVAMADVTEALPR